MTKVLIAGRTGVDPALAASIITGLENEGIMCIKEKEPLNGVELVLPNYGITDRGIMVVNKMYPIHKLDTKHRTKKELYIEKRNKINYKAKKRNCK